MTWVIVIWLNMQMQEYHCATMGLIGNREKKIAIWLFDKDFEILVNNIFHETCDSDTAEIYQYSGYGHKVQGPLVHWLVHVISTLRGEEGWQICCILVPRVIWQIPWSAWGHHYRKFPGFMNGNFCFYCAHTIVPDAECSDKEVPFTQPEKVSFFGALMASRN